MVGVGDLITCWIVVVGAALLTGCGFAFVGIVDSSLSGLDNAGKLDAPRMPPSPPSPPPPPPPPVGSRSRRRLLFDAENATPAVWSPPLAPRPVPNTTAIAEESQTIAATRVARMQRIDNKIAAARMARVHPSPAPTSRSERSASKRAGIESRHDEAEGIEEARAHAYDLVQGAIAAEERERLAKAAAAAAAAAVPVARDGISG
jgi:hypothetical protein